MPWVEGGLWEARPAVAGEVLNPDRACGRPPNPASACVSEAPTVLAATRIRGGRARLDLGCLCRSPLGTLLNPARQLRTSGVGNAIEQKIMELSAAC